MFSGALSTESKADLEDIAAALAIPFDGTKQEISSRIGEYLDTHSQLACNARFSGLFASRRRAPLGTITNTSGQQNQQQHEQINMVNQVYAPSFDYQTVVPCMHAVPSYHSPSF